MLVREKGSVVKRSKRFAVLNALLSVHDDFPCDENAHGPDRQWPVFTSQQ